MATRPDATPVREAAPLPHDQRQADIVQRLLRSQPVDPADLAVLDYDLHAKWHLGVIATDVEADAAIRQVAARQRCRALKVSTDQGTWAWFGAARPLDTAGVESTLSPDGRLGGLLAVGGLAAGQEGWRQTHREAKGALLLAGQTASKVVRYRDDPLRAAALENETLARWLEDLIEPLRRDPDRGLRLLSTLRAYIDAEGNYTSSAAVLKVRRQTVGERLRLIEKLLGRQIQSCLVELDIALRLNGFDSARDSLSR
jgi:hypothetical protein